MRAHLVGSMVAAVFGLTYVLANSDALDPRASWALRACAGAGFLVVLAAVARAQRRPPSVVTPSGRGSLGAYWLVVGAEVVALLLGVRVLSGPLDTPEAGVAWVSFVVGVHFFALWRIFSERVFSVVGTAITGCGITGLTLAAVDAGTATIDLASGVVPGSVLLGAGWWGARRSDRTS